MKRENKHMLWIENDYSELYGMTKDVRRHNVIVTGAMTVEQGIMHLMREPYDLVCLELLLPGSWMNKALDFSDEYVGVDIVDFIRNRQGPNKEAPIAVMSTLPLEDPKYEDLCHRLGYDIQAYLSKSDLKSQEVAKQLLPLIGLEYRERGSWFLDYIREMPKIRRNVW